MDIYLICYEFLPDKQTIPSTNAFFQSIGDHCRLLKSASLLATELDTKEIHDKIRDYTDINGEWTITKIDESFTGNSENVESVIAFTKLHNFKNI